MSSQLSVYSADNCELIDGGPEKARRTRTDHARFVVPPSHNLGLFVTPAWRQPQGPRRQPTRAMESVIYAADFFVAPLCFFGFGLGFGFGFARSTLNL